MAKEVQSKKRKASVPEEGAEQLKKAKKVVSEAPTEKKRKAAEDSTPIATKKSKKPKSTIAEELTPEPAKKDTASATPNAKNVKGSKSKNNAPLKETEEEEEEAEEESEGSEDLEDSEIDDQTGALLKGFESDGDSEDAENEGGLQEGRKIPKVPAMTAQNKKALKRAVESDDPETPGVVYVGHIPHGFYEHEMRAYFEQFGIISQLRLSRNRKSGASKHYAFIQFASSSVAEIVAKTMDSYLLFNHILKVRLIPDAQIPENLFKGANKRFKKVPWNKMAGRKLKQPASEATWEKRIEKEEARRADKAEKMKVIGYEFSAPKIKSAKNIGGKPAEPPVAISNGEDEPKAIEAGSVVEEQTKPKKERKPKATSEDGTASIADASDKKLKRKKSKSALSETAAPGDEAGEVKAKKSKKSKAKVEA